MFTSAPSLMRPHRTSNVHNNHSIHPFLDMRVQPASELQTRNVEISSDITAAEDNEDETRQ